MSGLRNNHRRRISQHQIFVLFKIDPYLSYSYECIIRMCLIHFYFMDTRRDLNNKIRLRQLAYPFPININIYGTTENLQF